MPTVSIQTVNGVDYDIRDASAREGVASLETQVGELETQVGNLETATADLPNIREELSDIADGNCEKNTINVLEGNYITENGAVAAAVDSSATREIFVDGCEFVLLKNAYTKGTRSIVGYNASGYKIWMKKTGYDSPIDFPVAVPSGTSYIRYTIKITDTAEVYVWRNRNLELVQSMLIKHSMDYFKLFTKTVHDSGSSASSDGTVTISAGGYLFAGINYPGLPHAGMMYIYGETDRPFENSQLRWAEADRYTEPTSMSGHKIDTLGNKFYAVIDLGSLDRVNYNTLIIRFDNRDDTTYGRTLTNVKAFMNIASGNEAACYVAKTGSDSNDGSIDYPVATVSEATRRGYTRICIDAGVYEQDIEFRYGNKLTLYCKDKTGRVIFKAPGSTIATSETKVSGHTKVYSASTDKEFEKYNDCIWQDGVPDATTLITAEERLPQQRGKQYRCDDTPIYRCEAETLSDALDEIDNSDGYKWFAEDGTIYFSRPQTVNESNPLCGSFTNYLFRYMTNGYRPTIEMTGIESKYAMVNLTTTVNSVITDCKCSNVFGAGCFRYDSSTGIKFIRCEAEHCYNGQTGDGFNGHGTATGEAFSKQTTCELIDCWSHDNNDDGYSDHERSEVVLRGGLYEWNKKGGVVPSYGSHCSCYGVISRNNYAGFRCVGVAEDGGVGTQMLCIDCLAENNNRGDSMAGFQVSQAGNKAILINCKSIGNGYGYMSVLDTSMRILDCTAKDNSLGVLNGHGNISIENTTPVTE